MQVYGFDTETTPLTQTAPTFKICSIYGNDIKQVFDSPAEIQKFFLDLRESTVMVSYNLPFDYLIISKQYNFKSFKITKINLSSRPYFIVMRRDTTINHQKVKFTITFLGLENFVSLECDKGLSLKNLAKIFETNPKLECDLNLPAESPELRKYCLRDAEIVYEIYRKHFFAISKGNRIRLSIPSIAYAELIASLPIKLDTRRSQTIKRIEQESYFGGRTEIFDYGKREASDYDINSLYPYAMSILKTPIKFLRIILNPPISKLRKIMSSEDETFIFCGSVWCYKPLLPVRINGKIIFPIGEVKGCWCEPEIKYGLQNHMIKLLRTNHIIVYKAQRGIFSNFVNNLYAQRQKFAKGTALNLLAKLKMNSAYGKFGQKQKVSCELTAEELQHEHLVDGGDYWVGGKKWTYREINGKWYKETKKITTVVNGIPFYTESYGKFTAVASFTTSQARVKLAKLIFPHKTEIYYCDTDAVITNHDFPVGEELGELKLEAKGTFEPFALKFYNLGKYQRRKGIPQENNLSQTKIIRHSENEIQFTFIKPLKMLEAKKRKLPAYSLVEVIKTVKRNYDKGYVANNHIYPLLMLGGKILNHPCENIEVLKKSYGELLCRKM